MGGGVRGVDKKVVHVNNKPFFCDHTVKGVVHELLKGGREIAKTKEHYSQFKESFMGDESSLPLMSVFDMDIVIPPSDVKFGENLCSLEFINKIRDEWEGVCIVNHVFIDITIVLTRADTTILLFNEEEEGCLWGI